MKHLGVMSLLVLIGTSAVAQNTWQSGVYQYDGAGNILNIGPSTYVYDPLGRLTKAIVASGGVTHTQDFTYDRFGNLTSVTTDGVTRTIGVDPRTNRLTDVVQGAYDEAGNLRLDGAYRYEYDAVGQMQEKVSPYGASEIYVYTADDERIGVRVAADDWRWTFRDLDGKPLREFRGSESNNWSGPWSWLEDHVWMNGRLIGSERPPTEGGRQHYHLDHLGTPRLATGPGALLAARHDYYPFGAEITPLRQNVANGFPREEAMKFTGHERDFSGGTNVENTSYLDYMHARTYSPNWGRFLSVDPGGWDPHRPQTWNRSSYVVNNPLRYADA